MLIGTKHRPFYRIVAVDERKKRTGGYLDLIGTYNPLTEPKDIRINQEKLEEWTKKGAVMSHGFLRITGKAPQKPPRKAKKTPEVKEEKAVEKTPDETPIEETVIANDSEAISQETAAEEPVAETEEVKEETA